MIFAKLIIAALTVYLGSKVIGIIDRLREKYKPMTWGYLSLSFVSVLLISSVILFIIVFPVGVEHTKPLSLFALIFAIFSGIFISKEISAGKVLFNNAIKFLTILGLIAWPLIYFVLASIDGSLVEHTFFYKVGVIQFTIIGLSLSLMGPLLERLP